jgi:hypothetical protein
VKTVKDLARLRKYSEGGMLETITNCEDNTRAHYAVDYLPDYAELRFELIRTYQLAERRREEMNKKGGKNSSFPIMDGHAQPGAAMMSCYRCGVKDSKMEHEPKVGKVKAKAKERWAAKETASPNLCATTGARGMGTAAMPLLAIFLTMVLREVIKEKEKKGQQHYQQKP